MILTVPTVFVDCLVVKPMSLGAKEYKAGDMITLPYGRALFGKAMGVIGAIQNEVDRALEASEMLAIYGGDCWFEQPAQTIFRVANYLAEAGIQTATKQ